MSMLNIESGWLQKKKNLLRTKPKKELMLNLKHRPSQSNHHLKKNQNKVKQQLKQTTTVERNKLPQTASNNNGTKTNNTIKIMIRTTTKITIIIIKVTIKIMTTTTIKIKAMTKTKITIMMIIQTLMEPVSRIMIKITITTKMEGWMTLMRI